MSIINKAYLTFSKDLLKNLEKSLEDPFSSQHSTFKSLIESGKETAFGAEHKFDGIKTIEDFQKKVPIREYDELSPYIERVRRGEQNILWNQKTLWMAKSSGTSSDKSKFIPVTPDCLKKCHYRGFQQMLSSYIQRNPNSGLVKGKALSIPGSLKKDDIAGSNILVGELSAILTHNSPSVAELLRRPSKKAALIPNFEDKLKAISIECSKSNITNLSGVPSWNLKLLQYILEYNNVSNIADIWPNFELYMHGGVNFESYRSEFKKIYPPNTNYIENYNASEGYFGFQDDPELKSMRFSLDNGIFYEFIPLDKLEDTLKGKHHETITLNDVVEDVVYAVIITTNAGLWRYNIGDTIKFTSTNPHRYIITGRTKLFINAFGEELMIDNAEKALAKACLKAGLSILEYTAAPVYMTSERSGYHQWAIEFSQSVDQLGSEKIEEFSRVLDAAIKEENSDYETRRNGSIGHPQVIPIHKGVFYKWLELNGKSGAQIKVPRLYNDRTYIEQIISLSNSSSEN